MMTLAEELAGHCLAVLHPLQPWGEGRMKRGRKKKESEGKKEKERNNREGETTVFYGDRASLGQLYGIYWMVTHYPCTG